METFDRLSYSPNSAAYAWDCSRSTVYALMAAGLIKYVPFGTDGRRIPVEEVRRIAEQGVPSIPKATRRAELI